MCTPGGELYVYTLDNTLVRQSKQLATEFSASPFTCLVWRNNVAVMGDAAGAVFIWNLKVCSRGRSEYQGVVARRRYCVRATLRFSLRLVGMETDEVIDTRWSW